MLRGLRAADAQTIQQTIGADQRLLLRIGALLQDRLALTAAVIDELARAPSLRDLIMDRRLKTVDADSIGNLADERGCADLDLTITDGEPSDDGSAWRVLAFSDEIGNPFAVDQAQAEPDARHLLSGVTAMLPTLAPNIRAPVEGLLQAQADDQRAAALEQLRYAAPPLQLVSELMPMVLADGADLVRERAIALVMAAGARPVVVDLIRAIQRDDHSACQRLAEAMRGLDAAQVDLVLAAVLAALSRGTVNQALITVATEVASTLAKHRGLERLLELLIPHAKRLSLVTFIRTLQQHGHDRVDDALRELLGQGDETDARLITLLAHPEHQVHGDLIERGVDLLLSPNEEPSDRMALAAALRRLGDLPRLAATIAERGDAILRARESTVYWLLAELCRQDAVQAKSADALATLLRKLAGREPGPHLVAVLEQQLPALLPANPALLSELVEPLSELIIRFRDRRSRDLVAEVITNMGRASITPLWNILEESPHQALREFAARVLADLYLRVDSDHDAATAAVTRLVAAANRATTREEKGTLLTAAAAISQLPIIQTTDLAEQVDQAANGLGDQALAAWGHLAAGPHIRPDRRTEIIDLLLLGITADLPDLPAEEFIDPNTQDTTYVLDSRLGSHTYSVPVMLTAIRRIGSSTHLPAPLLRRVVGELARHWKRVANWEVIWGPGNIQDLGQTLGHLARRPDFPANLRLQIAEALLPRVTQLSIAATLAEVFTNGEGPALGDLAGRATKAVIQAAATDEFADDERGELVDVLVGFLLITDLGEDDAVTRRRLAGLLATYRSHIALRAKERLREHMPHLSEPVQERLAWLTA